MENNNAQEEHKEDLISNYVDEIRQMEMEGQEAAVKKARNALFLASVLIFAGEMLGMAQGGGGFDYTILIIALVESGIFIALALWTRKRPYSAVRGGLIAFIGLYVLAAVVNGIAFGPSGVFKTLGGGFILKIVIIVALVRALKDARALQLYKKNADLE